MQHFKNPNQGLFFQQRPQKRKGAAAVQGDMVQRRLITDKSEAAHAF